MLQIPDFPSKMGRVAGYPLSLTLTHSPSLTLPLSPSLSYSHSHPHPHTDRHRPIHKLYKQGILSKLGNMGDTTTVKITKDLAKEIDEIVGHHGYTNRSEVVRAAVKDLLEEHGVDMDG